MKVRPYKALSVLESLALQDLSSYSISLRLRKSIYSTSQYIHRPGHSLLKTK